MKLFLLAIFLLTIGPAATAQGQESNTVRSEDNKTLLIQNELLNLINPITKKIPTDLQEQIDKAINQSVSRFFFSLPSAPSRNQLLQWEEIGPANVGGRTRAIAVQRAGGKIIGWAGSVTGGLWRNTDLMNSNSVWNLIDAGNNFVSTIVIHPTNPKMIAYGTGEGPLAPLHAGDGIYQTSDGGISWIKVTPSGAESYDGISRQNFLYVNKLIYLTDGTLAACTWTGVYFLRPGDPKWKKIEAFEGWPAYDIEYDGNNTVYVGAFRLVAKSTDRGSSWSILSADYFAFDGFDRCELALSKSNPSIIYAMLAQGREVSAMIRSGDGGKTWNRLGIVGDIEFPTFSNGQAWYNWCLSVDPTNPDKVYAGGVNLFRSNNGGQSWDQISYWNNINDAGCVTFRSPRPAFSFMHADQHIIYIDALDPDFMVIGNDGGVFISTNARAALPILKTANRGYNVAQLTSVAAGRVAPFYLTGSQDNGTRRFEKTTITETKMAGPGWDGGHCFQDALDPKTHITSYVGGYFFVTRDAGATYSCLYDGLDQHILPLPSIYLSQSKTLIAAGKNNTLSVWRNLTAPAVTYRVIGMDINSTISTIQRSPNIPTTFFLGTRDGKIIRVENAFTPNQTDSQIFDLPSILRITTPYPNVNISSISINPADENEIVCTVSNAGIPGIWRKSSTSPQWQNISGNLAGIPVYDGVFIKNIYSAFAVATEGGVFTIESLSQFNPQWDFNATTIGKVKVSKVYYDENAQSLLAATYGRGLFVAKLDNQPVAARTMSVIEMFKNFNSDGDELTFDPIDQKIKAGTNYSIQSAITAGATQTFRGQSNFESILNINSNNLPRGKYKLKSPGKKEVLFEIKK